MSFDVSFPVRNPLGGEFYLLHWWTYNDRGHLVLARNERSLNACADRIFREHPDAELKSYQRIEIVAPPTIFAEMSAKLEHGEAVNAFYHDMVWRLRAAVKAGEMLPAPFYTCQRYETDPSEDREKPTPWKTETHFQCKHCNQRIAMTITKEELFDRYAARWYAQHPNVTNHNTKGLVASRGLVQSRGRVAEADEKLSYAMARFGHHSSGIDLNEIDIDEANGFRPTWLSYDVLFYYKTIEDLDVSPLQAKLDALAAKAEESSRKYEEARKKDLERRTGEQNRVIIDFFKQS